MPWLRYIFYVLFIVSIISSTYLYNYALIQHCHFHYIDNQQPSLSERFFPTTQAKHQAPFRLLALGDPQLEGDTSIEHVSRDSFRWSKLRWNLRIRKNKAKVLRDAMSDLFLHGIPGTFKALRKRLDLLGNDYYLAHIYRTLHKQTNPTHVAVLGDLLGSQWISDEEFEIRAWRYWNRVFRDGVRVEDSITAEPAIEALDEDQTWRRRIVNIAGNHDIGYAGDLTPERLARFERSFGAANWETIFEVPGKDGGPAYLRLIILNSMNMDTPAWSSELQDQTYEFLNDVISRSEPVANRAVGTILLTHIPLHKAEGVCVDAPYFHHDHAGQLREQNHLSDHASKQILQGIFGMSGDSGAAYNGLGRNGIVVNGHDHEGCDVWHYLPRIFTDEEHKERTWNASRYEESESLVQAATIRHRDQYMPGMREITLRSMMGEFGGWGYLISAWYDKDLGEWQFEVDRCSAGVQHIWWAVHILLLTTIAVGTLVSVLALEPFSLSSDRRPVDAKKEHKRIPSLNLPADDELPAPVTTPPPRPPSPFEYFTGDMQISGGAARRRRPSRG